MTDKSKIKEVEDAGSPSNSLPPQTRGQRFKRHCGRRWWIYLIVFLLVALAVILGIIFGAIPAIAQKSVNNSSLFVDGIALRSPTNNSFTMDMNSTVHAHAPLSAHFSPQTFEMYNPPSEEGGEIVPFMELSVGQLQVEDEFTINVTNVKTDVLDYPAFYQFSKLVLGEEELQLGIRSNPRLNVGAIKFNVDYDKTVTLRGLNGLRGIELRNPEFLEEPLEDGTNMIVDGMIPNPSSFTLEVGDLVVNIAQGPIPLGYAVIKGLVLNPGNNNVKINNHIRPQILTLVEGVANTEENVIITLSANSTMFDGQEISWLSGPMKDAPPVNATLNPA